MLVVGGVTATKMKKGGRTEEQEGARRMTALAEVQGVPMGQYALTWMPSLRQNLIRASLRQKGCTCHEHPRTVTA